jgi:hypothetical protein
MAHALSSVSLRGTTQRVGKYIQESEAMFRRIVTLPVVTMIVFGAASASAQEAAQGPARVEVTYMPGGAGYVASKDDAPSSSAATPGTFIVSTAA